MLRISVVNENGTARLKLEGKLAHEWVQEAEMAWTTMTTLQATNVVVDLFGVSFVDEAGQQLLASMRHAGAELVGSGPLICALIDEIEEAESSAEHTLS